MPPQRLNALTVHRIKPPKSGRLEVWDTLVRGLALRVTENGSKSWVTMYRFNGRQRRMTLGPYPRLTLADARDLARIELAKIAKGTDPAEEKKAARNDLETVEVAAHEFVERYAKRNRSWKETERIISREMLPRWGHRRISEISRSDVLSLLAEIVDRGASYMANRVLATVRRFFNWCVERDKLAVSPAARIKAPGPEVARDRILTEAEICQIWRACEDIGWPFGRAIQFLLVTGQRRNEVATMRWSDVDLARNLWTLPREMTKANRLHEVPLSDLAVSILQELPRLGPLVFTTSGDRPIAGFSKAKRSCDAISEIPDWRIHDLRRTAASGMARLGIPPHVVEKILNHQTGTISGVAAVYNRHGYQAEKREALDAWGHALANILGKRDQFCLGEGL